MWREETETRAGQRVKADLKKKKKKTVMLKSHDLPAAVQWQAADVLFLSGPVTFSRKPLMGPKAVGPMKGVDGGLWGILLQDRTTKTYVSVLNASLHNL